MMPITKLKVPSAIYKYLMPCGYRNSTLEEIVETNVIPQLLAIADIKRTSHLYRDYKVAVHHNLQTTTSGSVKFLLLV